LSTLAPLGLSRMSLVNLFVRSAPVVGTALFLECPLCSLALRVFIARRGFQLFLAILAPQARSVTLHI
jgi:hypothetical protein